MSVTSSILISLYAITLPLWFLIYVKVKQKIDNTKYTIYILEHKHSTHKIFAGSSYKKKSIKKTKKKISKEYFKVWIEKERDIH